MKCLVLIVLILSSLAIARADGSPLPTTFDFTITSNPTGCKYFFPSDPCNVAVSGSGSFTTTEPIDTLAGGGFMFLTSITGSIDVGGTTYQFNNGYGICDPSNYFKYGNCSAINPEGLDGESGPAGSLNFAFLSQLYADGGEIYAADLGPNLIFAEFPTSTVTTAVNVTLRVPAAESSSFAMLLLGLASILAVSLIPRRFGPVN